MISAYALMYFSQHVFGVFSRDALKDMCEESSLIEASLVIGNLTDLALILVASFGSSGRLPCNTSSQ